MVLVYKSSLTERVVLLVVEIEGLSEEVQTVEVVETFDVGGVAAAVFLVDFHLINGSPGLLR